MRLILFALLVSSHGIAIACSCIGPGTVFERRAAHPLTAHVRILSDVRDSVGGPGARKWAALVLKDYSPVPGDFDDTLYLWTLGTGASCGFDILVGQEALVFGDTAWFKQAFGIERPAKAYSTSLCSGNLREEEIPHAVAELEGVPIRPGRDRDHAAAPRILSFSRSGFRFLDRYGADGRCRTERAPVDPGR